MTLIITVPGDQEHKFPWPPGPSNPETSPEQQPQNLRHQPYVKALSWEILVPYAWQKENLPGSVHRECCSRLIEM